LQTLRAVGLESRFVDVRAPENSRSRKPDPGGLLELLEQRHVAPSDAILVGDSSNDFEAGRAAGVFTIGIRGGYFHEGAEPDLWVDDFATLIDLWQNRFNAG
ncbi:MAG: HAD family hydrolase, partial [Planctomycetes bacterium]|nr:HAD family hydrolase [Planctomycetota bacterium]